MNSNEIIKKLENDETVTLSPNFAAAFICDCPDDIRFRIVFKFEYGMVELSRELIIYSE